MKQYVDGGNNVSRCRSDVDKAGKALAPHIFRRQGRREEPACFPWASLGGTRGSKVGLRPSGQRKCGLGTKPANQTPSAQGIGPHWTIDHYRTHQRPGNRALVATSSRSVLLKTRFVPSPGTWIPRRPPRRLQLQSPEYSTYHETDSQSFPEILNPIFPENSPFVQYKGFGAESYEMEEREAVESQPGSGGGWQETVMTCVSDWLFLPSGALPYNGKGLKEEKIS